MIDERTPDSDVRHRLQCLNSGLPSRAAPQAGMDNIPQPWNQRSSAAGIKPGRWLFEISS